MTFHSQIFPPAGKRKTGSGMITFSGVLESDLETIKFKVATEKTKELHDKLTELAKASE